MKNIKELFSKLSNKQYSLLIINIICLIPSIFILYCSFSILNLIIVICLFIICNILFILIKKENALHNKKNLYLKFLEDMTLFCFYQENDFEKFLSISNNGQKDTIVFDKISLYKNETSYMNSKIIVENVKKYKNFKYYKTLEQSIELIEKDQDLVEEDLLNDTNDKKGILPLLLITIFFSSFIFSIISLIIGGLNA